MGSNNEYEHQSSWVENQEQLFFEEQQKFVDAMIKNPEIPLGDGLKAQIERMPVQKYNPDNLTIKSIEDWINSINK
jgi:hypothetical protein